MPTKKPSAKKSARAAHPPGSTMTATLIPTKPWHQRGMVAIVLVVVIAVLAVGFAATGAAWSNKIKKLNTEVSTLERTLSEQGASSQKNASQPQFEVLVLDLGQKFSQAIELVNVLTGERIEAVRDVFAVLPELVADKVKLKLVATHGNAAYFTVVPGPFMSSELEGKQAIYRLDFSTKRLVKLTSSAPSSAVLSPSGYLLAYLDETPCDEKKCGSLNLINLQTDQTFQPTISKLRDESVCLPNTPRTELEWTTSLELHVRLCKNGRPNPDFSVVAVNPKGIE